MCKIDSWCHDYSDKMNLVDVRITHLSTHLSHRLLCLEIFTTIFSLIQTLGSLLMKDLDWLVY